jgi:hypothetical protein
VVMHWALPVHHAPALPILLASRQVPSNKAPPLWPSLDPQTHFQIFRC